MTELPIALAAKRVLNEQQQQAVQNAVFRRSFCLIGSAGTGKTTTVEETVLAMIEHNRIPPLEAGTDNLREGAPGVVFLSYTNRAVRNMAKKLPESLRSHALTYHKLLEFGPEKYQEPGPDGELVTKIRFVPGRTAENPLPSNLTTIFVDEASMPSIDLHNLLLDALPNPGGVMFIFIGDLNQLPPVYGDAILGKALLTLPIVELTRVYRQALESPIISLALGVKNNDFTVFDNDCKKGFFQVSGKNAAAFTTVTNVNKAGPLTVSREGQGTVVFHPWTVKLDQEDAMAALKQKIRRMWKEGQYDPNEDLVLCPWNKALGNDEFNRIISDMLGKEREADVHEVIAGFERHYYAVGDRVVVNKIDSVIINIHRNPRYLGKAPQQHSKNLNRWGHNNAPADEFNLDPDDIDIDALLEAAASDVEDKTNQCSHVIRVRNEDGIEIQLTTAGEVNAMFFGYAISVHKAQGSEARRVIFITHPCHSKMLSRELVYTALTRAAQELHILMAPHMLETAAGRPRIKGDSLAAKLEFFKGRLAERID